MYRNPQDEHYGGAFGDFHRGPSIFQAASGADCALK